MFRFLVSQLILTFMVMAVDPDAGRGNLVTTVSLVQKYGYPIEEYWVKTIDGYFLTIHRIPYSSKTGSYKPGRPVIFLMHGLLCSSADWVVGGPINGLAFILSDAGYDVWMGNARGNTYSKVHVTEKPHSKTFWNFGWHDIATKDLPAMINYILSHTGVQKLQYVGHSQGTTTFLVLGSLDATMQYKIKSAHLLAPVAWMKNMKSPLAKVAGPLLGEPNALVKLFGNGEFLPQTKFQELLGSVLCRDKSKTQQICTNTLFLIAGWDSKFTNETMIPDIMAISPAGCSINQIIHYLQEYQSGYFRQFDYGPLANPFQYKSVYPPNYNVHLVNVPTYLYYSENDYFANVIDVDRLKLSMNPFVLKAYRIPEPTWNHLDFLYGINVTELVYNKVLHDIFNA